MTYLMAQAMDDMARSRKRLKVQEVREIKLLLKQPVFRENLDCVAKAFDASLGQVRDIQAKRTWPKVRATKRR